MKTNVHKLVSNEVEKARERNRVAAKKRRLKEKLIESKKQSVLEVATEENAQLKRKIILLNQVKELMQREIDYQRSQDTVINFLGDESVHLYDLSLDIIDGILAEDYQEKSSETHNSDEYHIGKFFC
ncbi:hypothetical protein BpHYR1_028382 [Brachionus plicatilis]|uniref:BZIP domain-containing protein n=1 Tax=Brachionus plicatilis TaxID=10195 RepID=A0A3M7RN39_BRAPC|nr:hypothetical protein BpHYR1_028382 [Brachionus plicatilis]